MPVHETAQDPPPVGAVTSFAQGRRGRPGVSLLWACLGLTACFDGLSLPTPPSLEALAARYDAPTALLEPDELRSVVAQSASQWERLQQLGGLGGIVGGVRTLDGELTGDAGIALKRIPLQADAVLTLRGDCGNDAPAGGQPGRYGMTMVVDDTTLRPVVWGRGDNCHHTREVAGAMHTARFSGEVVVYLPAARKLGRAALRDLVVSFSLDEFSVDGTRLGPQSGDFRVRAGRVELLIDLGPRGTVVVARDDSEPGKVRVRGDGTSYVCAAAGTACELSP